MTADYEAIRTWRTAGGDGSRRGVSNAVLSIPTEPSRVLEAMGALTSSPVFADDGTVFFADRAGYVQSYSLDGRLKWREPLEGGVEATPVLDTKDKTLYVATMNGQIARFDAATGERTGAMRHPDHDPRILSDLLLVRGNRIVYSLWGKWKFVEHDLGPDGVKFEWDAGLGPRSAMSGMPGGEMFGIRVEDGDESKGTRLFAVDPASGKERSVLFVPTDEPPKRLNSSAAPVLSDGALYAALNGADNCVLYRLDNETGRIEWSRPLECTVNVTPCISPDGVVVLAGMDGSVRAVNPDGTHRYAYNTGTDYILSAPVCDREGKAALGDPEGRVHVIDSDGNGRVVFEAERAFQARFAFSPKGLLYAPCTDGRVYVFA